MYLYLSLTLWLIAGMCCRRLSIGSFCLPSMSAKSSAERAPCRLLTGTGGIYSVSKNFQTLYLLSSWLPLASSSLLPPTPKSNPLILCLQFWGWCAEREWLSQTAHFSRLLSFWSVFAARLPSRACWCLLVQPSCALLCCKHCCDLAMADTEKKTRSECVLI